jgi:hypothetical protein
LYQRKLSSPKLWREKGEILLQAAELIEPKVLEVHADWKRTLEGQSAVGTSQDYIGVYFMLIAYALENFLKSDHVKKMVRGKRNSLLYVEELPAELKSKGGHELVDLARTVGIELESSEADLLNRLARCAKWAGRYPVPTRFKDIGPSVMFASDVKKIKRLIERVKIPDWRRRHRKRMAKTLKNILVSKPASANLV